MVLMEKFDDKADGVIEDIDEDLLLLERKFSFILEISSWTTEWMFCSSRPMSDIWDFRDLSKIWK